MRVNPGVAGLGLVAMAVLTVALVVAGWPRPLAAFVSVQGDSDPIIITERGCDFDLDNNSDGQPDQPFEPVAGGYLPQDTALLVHCWFQVTTVADAVIQLESGLAGWSATAEITRETEDYSRDVELNIGENEIVAPAGGHHVNLNMSGQTPRGSDRIEVSKGYWHDLQVPNLFRLVDIVITTDARDKKIVVSETVSSASTAYIRAHDAIAKAENDPGNALPPPALNLARNLLDEGYPRMAERVVELRFTAGDETDQDSSWPIWFWVVVGFALVAVVVISLAIIWWIFLRPSSTLPDYDDDD